MRCHKTHDARGTNTQNAALKARARRDSAAQQLGCFVVTGPTRSVIADLRK